MKWLGLCALMGFGLFGWAQTTYPPRRAWEVTTATSTIKVDGKLDEAAWQNAVVLDLPFEWFPGDNSEAVVKTECLVTFDEKNLYVGFRAYDPDPSKIRAYYADRDDAFNDDTVGFVIDTFNDKRRGFQFRINPLGVQMEAINSDVTGSEDWAWDAIWDAVGQFTDFGYVVELSLPFNQLRFAGGDGVQTWNFMALRDYPRTVRHRMRSTYQDRSKDCFICQLEPMAGFTGMEPGLNLQITPTVTGTRTDERVDFPNGPLIEGDEDADAGATVRWSVTPNATLSAAINPDFSQVEADVAQLNVNERFALFFPERRPFFLEGNDFFETPENVVFTRTVADPDAGLKYTAKHGKNAIGVLYAQDNVNQFIIPANQGSGTSSINEELDSGVLRYRRDIGRNSNIGAILTHRSGDQYENTLYGVDGNIRITGKDSIRFQALATSTEYDERTRERFDQPDGSFDGDGFYVRYQHRSRDWRWNLTHRNRDPNFRADFGFIPRVDIRQSSAYIQRIFYGGENHWYRRLYVSASADVTDNHEGFQTDKGQDFEIGFDGPWQSYMEVGYHPNDEAFQGVVYDNPRHSFYAQVRPSGALFASISVRWGNNIDFANARQADFVTISPELSFKLGRRFDAFLRYNNQTLDVDGGELFTAELTQANLMFHINQRTFVRAIVQHTDVERDPLLYTFDIDAQSENLFTQFLFSYKINPQTVFLAGYSDNGQGNEIIDLTKTDRTFFVKFGYAFVL